MNKTSTLQQPGYERLQIDVWQEVSVFAVLLIKISWLVPWYQWFIDPNNIVPSWPVIAVLGLTLIITYVIARLAAVLKVQPQIEKAVLSGVLLAAAWAGIVLLRLPPDANRLEYALSQEFANLGDLRFIIPDELVIAMVILYMWRSGLTLARAGAGHMGVLDQFRFGAGMFLAFAIVTIMLAEPLPLAYLFLFLFSGLLGMATARVAKVSRFRGGALIPFSRNWLGAMLMGTLVIGGIAGGLGWFMGSEYGHALFIGMQAVFFSIALFMVSPVLLLLKPLIGKIKALLPVAEQQLVTPVPGVDAPADVFGVTVEVLDESQRQLAMIKNSVAVVLWIVFVVLVLVVLRSIKTRRYARERGLLGYQDTVQQPSMWDALRAFISDPSHFFGGARKRYADRLLAAAHIRRMYAKFLNLCIDLNVPRQAHETPLEFLSTAVMALPVVKADMRLLTNAYLRVRYGELPESEEEVQSVETAWKNVQAQGQAILKAKKAEGRK